VIQEIGELSIYSIFIVAGNLYKVMGRDIIKRIVEAELIDPPYGIHTFVFGDKVLTMATHSPGQSLQAPKMGNVTWL